MSKTRITETTCISVPECAAEFAVIGERMKNLEEKVGKNEESIVHEIKDLRTYLKNDYTDFIKVQIIHLQKGLETTQKQVAGMYKKMLIATGGVGAISFFIGLAVPLIIKVIGG
jgi:hypothetical protein